MNGGTPPGDRLVRFGGAVLPIVALAVIRLALPGVVPARADVTARGAPSRVVEAKAAAQLTPAQERMAAFVERARELPFGPSPFVEGADYWPAPTEAARAGAPGTPVFIATSLLTGRSPVAVVNGKPRRIGEEVEPGWRLRSVDAARGVCVIEGANGRLATASIRSHAR